MRNALLGAQQQRTQTMETEFNESTTRMQHDLNAPVAIQVARDNIVSHTLCHLSPPSRHSAQRMSRNFSTLLQYALDQRTSNTKHKLEMLRTQPHLKV